MKFIALFLCLIFYQLQFSETASETTEDSKGKSRTVSTLLNAKWNSTPTALEIAEFLNDEDPSYLWTFLEDLSANVDTLSGSKSQNCDVIVCKFKLCSLHNIGVKSFLETDKSKYEALVDLSRKYLSEAQVSLMRFSLGLHVYSPKIEMFQQIAMVQGVPKQKCEAVAEVNGKLTCDPSLIKTFLNEKPK
jgi:UDP-glucose:glycoprotein glucosyltransferase